MGRIQFVTFNPERSSLFKEDGIFLSSYRRARVFDEFEINVINLQVSEIWKNKGSTHQSINCSRDLDSLGKIRTNAERAKTIVLLPQDGVFDYDYVSYPGKYMKRARIKDMLSDLTNRILKPVCGNSYELEPGVSSSLLNGQEYESDFTIHSVNAICSVECKNIGGHPTVIRIDDLYLCTVKISSHMALRDLLKELGLEESKIEPVPEWLEDIPFRNEFEVRKDIAKKQAQIEKLAEDCKNQKLQLEKNEHLKSILCTKDTTLENTVREMLAEVLDVPNDFQDENEEDFRYVQDERVFLFEIKGSVRNLKREQITKTDSHVQMYLDDNEGNELAASPKGILIFSGQIEKAPGERDSYPDDQIKLALRNEVAVVSAELFLLIYEGVLDGLITKEEVLDLLWNCNGELTLADLPDNLQKLHQDV